LEPTLLMAILEESDERNQVKEVEKQKVSLYEEDVGYKETNMDSLWYLDNGASNHMTGVREHFKELDEKVSGKVRFGDGSYIEIKGKGSILIECDDEKQRIISYLDDRSSRMVYLGNEQGSKAYRLFDPTAQKICVSRDVKFEENETWDWKEYINNLYENTEELLLAEDEPKNYKEASSNQKWIEAMKRQDNGKVYRLIKALYGPRQAPRAWNIKLDKTLKSSDFNKCALEQAIYTKILRDSTIILGVYVDDLIITGTPKKEIDKFKAQMEEKFEMSDLGLLAYYLGIKVTQTSGDISIKQTAYANKILNEAGMIDCNETLIPMDPGTRLTKITEGTMVNSIEYRSLIGCLRYVLHTRLDLSYSVGLLSRFMQEPREQHMKAIRQVLRYVKGTLKKEKELLE
nr:ribonuclease H-like domain, reverse transcriptase, RNA-dependent DNA polymerase [Tanacetum cinerariifolium]